MVQEVIQAIAITSEFIGSIMIGLAVLRVHGKIKEEHKIDKHVAQVITKERSLTILGLVLITIGFILNFF